MDIAPSPTPRPGGGKILIHDFSALDLDGNRVWFLLGVSPDRSEEFLAAVNQAGVDVDVTKFGKVLASGYGSEPPESVRLDVHWRYGVRD